LTGAAPAHSVILSGAHRLLNVQILDSVSAGLSFNWSDLALMPG
jgi:hypothetical protein